MDAAEGWWRVVGMTGDDRGVLKQVRAPMERTPHPSSASSLALASFATLSPEGRGEGCKREACPAFAYCQGRCAAKREARQELAFREDYSGGGYLA